MLMVNCPACARPLEVDPEYRDWIVRCPHCDHEFVTNTAILVPPARIRRTPPRDYDDDDDDRRPRQRHYDNDSEEYLEDYSREKALRLVAAPGMWMEAFGWIHALLTVAGCLLALAAARDGNQPEEAVWVSFALAVIGILFSVLLIISGRNLRALASRGWAMAGAIACVVLLSMFTCLAVAHGAIGIWALVTLEKPEVRAEFGLPLRQPWRRQRRWD